VPELPEAEALREFPAERLTGHEIVRVLPAAINVLKTYDPPLSAVEGRAVASVARYGKFLGLATDGGPHPVTRSARAGRG
jgi:formamidopyrimidine-DNA glycosylase